MKKPESIDSNNIGAELSLTYNFPKIVFLVKVIQSKLISFFHVAIEEELSK